MEGGESDLEDDGDDGDGWDFALAYLGFEVGGAGLGARKILSHDH